MIYVFTLACCGFNVNGRDAAVVCLDAASKCLDPGPESMALVTFGCETWVCCADFHYGEVLDK